MGTNGGFSSALRSGTVVGCELWRTLGFDPRCGSGRARYEISRLLARPVAQR